MRFNLDNNYLPEWQRMWTRWFAWRPVVTQDKKLVWLEFVERKKELMKRASFYGPLWTFQWEWQYQ